MKTITESDARDIAGRLLNAYCALRFAAGETLQNAGNSRELEGCAAVVKLVSEDLEALHSSLVD